MESRPNPTKISLHLLPIQPNVLPYCHYATYSKSQRTTLRQHDSRNHRNQPSGPQSHPRTIRRRSLHPWNVPRGSLMGAHRARRISCRPEAKGASSHVTSYQSDRYRDQQEGQGRQIQLPCLLHYIKRTNLYLHC